MVEHSGPNGVRVDGLTKTISFPLGDVNVRLTGAST